MPGSLPLHHRFLFSSYSLIEEHVAESPTKPFVSCSVGFQPVGEEWPSVYTHPELQFVLVVYVDDFKMAVPKNVVVI